MASRGSYEKGRQKRELILQAVLEVIAERGYSGATLQELSNAVGVNRTALLHYFDSKEELFTEVVRRRDEQREAAHIDDSGTLGSGLLRAVRADAATPGLTQLIVHLSADATDPAHPSRAYFEQRLARVRDRTTRAFEEGQRQGTIGAEIDPADAAVLLAALRQGLQILSLHDSSIDMPRLVGRFLEMLGVETGPDATG